MSGKQCKCGKKRVSCCSPLPSASIFPPISSPPCEPPTYHNTQTILITYNSGSFNVTLNKTGTLMALGFPYGMGIYSLGNDNIFTLTATKGVYTLGLSSNYSGYPGSSSPDISFAILVQNNANPVQMELYGYTHSSPDLILLDSVQTQLLSGSPSIGYLGNTYIFNDVSDNRVNYRYTDMNVINWVTIPGPESTIPQPSTLQPYIISPNSNYPRGRLIGTNVNGKLFIYNTLDTNNYLTVQMPLVHNYALTSTRIGCNYDGSLIAVCSYYNDGKTNSSLYVYSYNGTSAIPIFQTEIPDTINTNIGESVTMSMDGKTIVVGKLSSESEIILITYKSCDLAVWDFSQIITAGNTNAVYCLSPDGNRLVTAVTSTEPVTDSVSVYQISN